ncbi:MAG TPA: selenocysteine-specific translation elongation factor [Thermoanaerobacterales bacterium]|jgi:selenocysteine-specific elongation factor|nr:selenocysteine-specific translation elongation factor [Thermoanaerobacterales bacterium]
MSNIILGTAGHIDHGKTTLIKALTGIDADRLSEEKKRGITIDLGFAHLSLPSGQEVSIVDVPGHERFVKNMVAGVGGIDMVLFIVAADEGVMPQTKEHLNILKILNIERGLTVLTKKDKSDDEWLELVIEDVREQIKGTFLEKSPIIPVSSITGEGIETLKAAIDEMCSKEILKDNQSPFRLPIDRIFTMSGIGTVVTGSLLYGTASIGDDVEIFPKGKRSRIRSIQSHGKTSNQAFGGQRIAFNLTDLKVEDMERGDVVAKPGTLIPVTKALAYFKLLDDAKGPLKNRERIRFHTGTKEIMARIAFLDRDKLLPGENAFVRLIFEETVACAYKDRYVVRSYSPITTIGGGQILYVNPRRIKKSIQKRAQQVLQNAYEGDLHEFIQGLLELFANEYLQISKIAPYTGKSTDQINAAVKTLVSQDRVKIFKIGEEDIVVDSNYYSRLTERAISIIENYHKNEPLSDGIAREELRSRIKMEPSLFDNLLNKWIDEDLFETSGSTVKRKGFEIKLNESQKGIFDKILKLYDEGGWSPPSINEVLSSFPTNREKDIKQMISMLTGDRKLIKLNEELYMTKEWVKQAKQLLRKHFETNRELTASDFRKMLGTTRKYAIPLLEHMDSIKLTKRQPNGVRHLSY